MGRNILFFIFFYSSLVYSKPRTSEQALGIAKSFYENSFNNPLTKSLAKNYTLKFVYGAYKEGVTTRSSDNVYYYIFNIGNQNGFVVVSGDDRANNILGYSTTGNFSVDSIPPNFRNWLNIYQKELQSLMDNSTNTLSASEVITENINATSVPSLLGKTKWDQDSPYNASCPKSGTQSTYTGCVATAIAQIMRYHQYPMKGIGTKKYTTESLKKDLSVDFSTTSYDWSNMLDTYNGSESSTQKDAVATLMYHCGVAANMDYGTSASSAFDEDAAIGLINYFGYDANLRTLYRDYYSSDEWEAILRNELNNNRPVLYGGGNKNNEGHAFVCDGYDTNNLYSFNWGWSGYCDGYYALTSLNPNSTGTDIGSSDGGFTIFQDMTIGIQKPSSESKPSYQLLLDDTSPMVFTANQTTTNSLFNISVPFYNGGITTFNGEVAIGLYQGSSLLSILGETSISDLTGFNNGSFASDNVYYSDLSIPQGIKDGTYQLYSIYKGNDEAAWSKMRGLVGEISFFNIQVVDGKVTLSSDITSGLENMNSDKIVVYPNPTSNNLYIQSEDIIQSIYIADLTGKQILFIQPKTNGEITIPVSSLNAGTYIICIKTEHKQIIKKIIKN